MRLGAHLPLADLGAGLPSADDLTTYARVAHDLGYSTLAANDHLVWKLPWLDGPTALASILAAAEGMVLATTVALPVVRHPAPVAKMLTTLAALASGPVVGALGPGSSRSDYDAVGIPFDERWARFDEALRAVRALVCGEAVEDARWYPVSADLSPRPLPPPDIWFGSWGSDRRIAAMAGVADGWLASAYNATPDQFAEARTRLDGHLRAAGREPAAFPDAVATAWMYVTEDRAEADRVRTEVLAPTLGRDPAGLSHLPIGGAAHCIEVLAAYAAAGAREVLVWPLLDSVAQLELCAEAASGL
jgi:alkanesulfonate monooxygenase SsuD/methylene tetrahydromethanopterin reductase-like flavin-dependent oxidoreductase (luciferase family)